jgi:hypothetical protein
MFGGAVTYTDAPDRKAELVGGEVDLACWWGARADHRGGRAPRDRG